MLAFVSALLVIVAIHEYGHYIVGRWCGIWAEKFSLGMGPVLASRTDKRGTQWQIAALPIGGYVKFLGDANAASVGGDQVAGVDPRHTMLGAPVWARALTVAAGPIANFLLSIVLFTGLMLVQGQTREPLVVESLRPVPAAFAHDLQVGDELVAIQGIALSDTQTLSDASEGLTDIDHPIYTVRRDGREIDITGPMILPPIVGSISPRSAAYSAGVKKGDVILAIDGTPITRFTQIRPVVDAGQGALMRVDLWRDGETLSVDLAPKVTDLPTRDGGFETRYLIGVTSSAPFVLETERPAFGAALWRSVQNIWMIIDGSFSGLWHILTGQISTCNLSSPVGIAETSGAMAAQGWASYIGFIAFLSTAVGLLNLFPIPILDGGHLVFHAWEGITGKPPSERALSIAMAIGFALLMSLMGIALLNDVLLCR